LKCSDEGCTVGAGVAVGDDGHGEGAGVGQDRERDGYVSGDASERNHLADSRAEKGNRDIRAPENHNPFSKRPARIRAKAAEHFGLP